MTIHVLFMRRLQSKIVAIKPLAMARIVHFVLLLLVSFSFVSAATQNNINLPTPSKGPIEKAEALPQSLPKNRFSEEKVAVKRDYVYGE
ncbi:hypothetical protein QR680_018200 [Steinernema hermaphroditum]|uniref:Uncharacterized protein n=1 Tax=Steinernema hermaphroditum TaxID=289476 RepID=A0AA39HHZ1_9BILA|nr:hypothetical protein QR680_018200 [Steinernema hermaphroditum]